VAGAGQRVNQFGIMPAYTGTAVHDALSVYDCYPARHALCGAHLARELTAAEQAHPDQHWPVQARTALVELDHLANMARDQGLAAIPHGPGPGGPGRQSMELRKQGTSSHSAGV
jgi:transposase